VPAVVEVYLHALEAALGVARRHQQQVAGHPQVHDQVDLVGQLPDEPLAAAFQPLDAPALDRLSDLLGRCGLAPARIEDLDVVDAPTLDGGRQLTADRLDFRQLGHQL
jgi:hypothetical protein